MDGYGSVVIKIDFVWYQNSILQSEMPEWKRRMYDGEPWDSISIPKVSEGLYLKILSATTRETDWWLQMLELILSYSWVDSQMFPK